MKMKLLNVIESYTKEEVMSALKGCFNDPNCKIELVDYGYVHDTGFKVYVYTSTGADIDAGYEGMSEAEFLRVFEAKVAATATKWEWNCKYGYH